MDTSAIDNLVEWIFDNKQIFNSKQYIDLMSLVQKLVVDKSNEKKEDYATLMRLNNYRLEDSDSEDNASEADNDDDASMLRSSDAESDEEEEDFATYTGRYINSY